MMSFIRKMLVLIALLVVPCVASAAEDVTVQDRGPIEVSADRLELDDNTSVLAFTGNAVAVQGDVTIYAGRLTVSYRGKDREIEQIVAEDNVKIVQESRTATGDKAVFYRDEGRVVLTGSPKVSQGENFVQGQEITIFLNDKRSIVSGGSGGRVNAVFTPRAEEKP